MFLLFIDLKTYFAEESLGLLRQLSNPNHSELSTAGRAGFKPRENGEG